MGHFLPSVLLTQLCIPAVFAKTLESEYCRSCFSLLFLPASFFLSFFLFLNGFTHCFSFSLTRLQGVIQDSWLLSGLQLLSAAGSTGDSNVDPQIAQLLVHKVHSMMRDGESEAAKSTCAFVSVRFPSRFPPRIIGYLFVSSHHSWTFL